MLNVTSLKIYPHKKLIPRKVIFSKINLLKVVSLTETNRKTNNSAATKGVATKTRRLIISVEIWKTRTYDIHVATLPCYRSFRSSEDI